MAYSDASSRSGTGSKPRRRRRKKLSRRTRALVFPLLILFGLAGLVGIYSLIFTQREKTQFVAETPIASTATYLNTDNGLLYQTDGKINFYHLTDRKKDYTYGTGASDIRMSGSSDIAAVYNDFSLQVIGKKTPVTFTGTIMALECGQKHLGILLKDESGAESLVLITVDGVEINRLTLSDQYIVDFGFFYHEREMIWVQTLSVASSTPTTTITTYDVATMSNSGVMQIQSQLVDGIYITDDSMFVCGTNQIIRYTHDGSKEVYRVTVYGYRVVDFSTAGDSPTFLMTPRGGDIHSVKMLTLAEDGNPDTAETYLQLPTEGVTACIMNGSLIVVSRQQVFTYTLKGKLSSETTLEVGPVDDAVKLTEKVLLLSYGGMFYLTTVK